MTTARDTDIARLEAKAAAQKHLAEWRIQRQGHRAQPNTRQKAPSAGPAVTAPPVAPEPPMPVPSGDY